MWPSSAFLRLNHTGNSELRLPPSEIWEFLGSAMADVVSAASDLRPSKSGSMSRTETAKERLS